MDRYLIHFSFMSKCVQTSDGLMTRPLLLKNEDLPGSLQLDCFGHHALDDRSENQSEEFWVSLLASFFFLFVCLFLLICCCQNRWENPCFALCPSGQTSVWFPCNDSVPGPEGEALVEEKVGNIGRDQKASKHTFVSKTVRRALGHLLFCGSNWVSNLVMVI